MASNNSNFSVHSESATRAPVVPQLATGVDRHSADDQGRAQSATGIESDLQARSGGMDLESDTHPIFFIFWLIGREAVTRLYLIIVAPAPVALELLGYVRISQQFFGTSG